MPRSLSKTKLRVLLSAAMVWAAMATLPAARAEMHLKIGLSPPDIAHLALWIAEANNMFKAEGIDVQLVQFESDAAAAQGLTAGAVEITSGSIEAVLNSYATGRDLTTFWSECNFPGFDWYGPAKYSSLKDLKGKTIGISSIASMTHRLSQWAVAQVGLDPDKDVKYLAVGGPLQRVAALKAGQVDAIPATAPGIFLLQQDGFKPLLQIKDLLPDFEYETLYGRRDGLKTYAPEIRASLRAIIYAIRWAKQHPEETTAIVMKNLGAKDSEHDLYRKTVDLALPYYPEDGHFADKSIDVFIKFYRDQGKIKEAPPHSAFTDYSFIEYIKAHPVK